MISYDISNLKLNPEVIADYFKTKDGIVTVSEEISVIYPERYHNRNLAIPGSTTRLVAIYAIVDTHGNYCLTNAPIFMELAPINVIDIDIDGLGYKQLLFEKNSVYSPNSTMVKEDDFMYDLFDEFLVQGRIPWFMGYDDVSNILLQASLYADRDIGDNPIAMEILTAIIAKASTNKELYYRQVIKTEADKRKIQPVYFGLQNVYHTYDNTISKVVGNYYAAGVNNALLKQETKSTKIEDILLA